MKIAFMKMVAKKKIGNLGEDCLNEDDHLVLNQGFQ